MKAMKTLLRSSAVALLLILSWQNISISQICQNGDCASQTSWKIYAEQATVRIVCNRSGGSGVVVYNGSDGIGLVLTNAHVVGGHKQATITFLRGGSVTAEVKQIDDVADLAMLVFDSRKVPSHVGSARISPIEPQVGERVVAVGYEYGQLTTKSGVITSKREIVPPKNWSSWTLSFPAYPGLSGSPVYLANTGDVVGIIWGGSYNSSSMVGLNEIKRFVYKKCDWLFGRTAPVKPEDKTDWFRLKAEIDELKSKIENIGVSDNQISSKLQSIEAEVNAKIEKSAEEQRQRLAKIDARLAVAEQAASGIASTVGATTGPVGAAFGAIALVLGLSRRYIRWRAGLDQNNTSEQNKIGEIVKRELLDVLSQVMQKK